MRSQEKVRFVFMKTQNSEIIIIIVIIILFSKGTNIFTQYFRGLLLFPGCQ